MSGARGTGSRASHRAGAQNKEPNGAPEKRPKPTGQSKAKAIEAENKPKKHKFANQPCSQPLGSARASEERARAPLVRGNGLGEVRGESELHLAGDRGAGARPRSGPRSWIKCFCSYIYIYILRTFWVFCRVFNGLQKTRRVDGAAKRKHPLFSCFFFFVCVFFVGFAVQLFYAHN